MDSKSIFASPDPQLPKLYHRLQYKATVAQQFLDEHTRMNEFLNSVYNLVDISVEDYIQRGFESLMISFGCTGGQHRSVYAAEQTARHLKNKYKVKVEVKHINQENWVKEKVAEPQVLKNA